MKPGTVLTAENLVLCVLLVISCHLRCVEEEAVTRWKEQKAGDGSVTGVGLNREGEKVSGT